MSNKSGADQKMVAGLCGVFLGAFGVHKFILGYQTEGIIMACATIFTCFFGGIIMGGIGMVEGILYLTKSDEEFEEIYMVNKRPWF